MELDKILRLSVEYVSDYVEDFLHVIRRPGFQLQPTPVIAESASISTPNPSLDSVRRRIDPRLVRFLIISIFLGSVVNGRIPGRSPSQEFLVTIVILIVYWGLFSALSHIVCWMFGSRTTFTETLSACLQVFAVVYVLSSCCGFLYGTIVQNFNLGLSPLYFRLLGEHPIYAYFVSQFLLTLPYLIIAMKRVHKLTFQRRAKTTVIQIALRQLELVAFCFFFLITTMVIVVVSKFNYEVHSIPLDQPEIVSIDSPVVVYQNVIESAHDLSSREIKPQTRQKSFANRSLGGSTFASAAELGAAEIDKRPIERGRFGALRNGRPHQGLDIAGELNRTPVYAYRDGIVQFAGLIAGSRGWTVVIAHDGGVIQGGSASEYTHLQANSIPAGVVEGSKVTQGQQIGVVGDTGNARNATSAHLHFSIKTSEGYIDPETHISNRSAKASWPISRL